MEPNKNPPMRIDTQAAAILNSSCRAVEAILAKRAQLDTEGKADLPLFVQLGELHDHPSHILHHVSVIKGLLDAKQKIAFASELPYDYLAKEYCAIAGVDPTAKIMTGLYFRDKFGEASRKYIFSSAHCSADYASNLLQDYLLRNKIPTRLTDSPRLQIAGMMHQFIDPNDGCNQKSMEACGKDPLDMYSAVSRAGVYIRNRHMMVHSADLSFQSTTRIVLQQCGQAHVLGTEGKYPIEQSLAAQFKQRGIPSLSLLLDGNFHETIPSEEDFRKLGFEALITTGLPGERFPYTPGQRANPEEIKYTDRLLAGTGLLKEFGSIAEIDERRLISLRETQATFRAWDKEFELDSSRHEKEKQLAQSVNTIYHLLAAPGKKP